MDGKSFPILEDLEEAEDINIKVLLLLLLLLQCSAVHSCCASFGQKRTSSTFFLRTLNVFVHLTPIYFGTAAVCLVSVQLCTVPLSVLA